MTDTCEPVTFWGWLSSLTAKRVPVELPAPDGIPRGRGAFVDVWRGRDTPESVVKEMGEAGLSYLMVRGPHARKKKDYTTGGKTRDIASAVTDAGLDVHVWGWPEPRLEGWFADRAAESVERVGAVSFCIDCEDPYLNKKLGSGTGKRLRTALVDLTVEALQDTTVGWTSYARFSEFKSLAYVIAQTYDPQNTRTPDKFAKLIARWRKVSGVMPIIAGIGAYRKTLAQFEDHLNDMGETTDAAVWSWRQLDEHERAAMLAHWSEAVA